MIERRGMIAIISIAIVTAVGCGGGKSAGSSSGGVSLYEQFQRAMADTNPPSRADALTRIGYLRHRAGDTSGAATSFHEAGKAAAEIDDPYRRATAEALLASAYARTNTRSGASKTLKNAETAAARIDSAENKVDALSRIAGVYGADLQEPGNATAKLKDAERIAGEISDLNDRLIAVAAVIRGYHKAGKMADVDRLIGMAGELAGGISDARKKSDALATFGRALVDANRKEEGVQQLDAALQSAQQIDSVYKKVFALTGIAEQYSHAGESEKARTILAEAAALAKTIPEVDLRKEAEAKVRQLSTSSPKAK